MVGLFISDSFYLSLLLELSYQIQIVIITTKPYGVILNERTTRMTSTISSKGQNKSNIGIGQRLKIHFLSCLRLWVLKLMRPFLFWLILKTLRTSVHSAAEYVRVLEEKKCHHLFS